MATIFNKADFGIRVVAHCIIKITCITIVATGLKYYFTAIALQKKCLLLEVLTSCCRGVKRGE